MVDPLAGLHLPSGLRAAVSGAHPHRAGGRLHRPARRAAAPALVAGVRRHPFVDLASQSHLYLVLFRMPFFDVFRSYFLVGVLVVFGLLIMSGYGMDAFLTLGAEARRGMLSRALITVGAMTALAAAAVAWPLIEGDSRALAAKIDRKSTRLNSRH